MEDVDDRIPSERWERSSPPRRNRSPNVRGGMRCPDCSFTASSEESLNTHFRRTRHKPRDDGRTRDRGARSRTDRQRRPDSRERRRRSASRERRRRSTSRERRRTSDNRERSRRSDSRERRRKSDSRERRRRSPSRDRRLRSPSKEKIVLEKQPTPKNVPDDLKKPEPTPSGVPGMVPDHIRNSLLYLQDYVNLKEREPVIGLQYVLEYRVRVRYDKIDLNYYCELCEMDSRVIPMVDHVCGFKHRKAYVSKEYPYVLKALFQTKEDKAVFMRRIAEGIEQEEGPKMYKTDSILKMVPLMNVKAVEARQSKRRTRWDHEGDRQKKMEQALDFLDSYEIETQDDLVTVTDLLEKMSAELKTRTDKLREEALFPAKVARAKGVAANIQRNVVIAYMYEKHVAKVNKQRAKMNLPKPGAPFQPNNVAFPQLPFYNQQPNIPMLGNPLQNQAANFQIDQDDEDIDFLKNLMELLDVLPDSVTEEDDFQMDADFLLLLKSALLDKTENLEDMPEDQLMQLVSLVQGLTGMDNDPQNIMAPKNPAAMGNLISNALMPMASTANVAVPGVSAQASPNPLLQLGAMANISLPGAHAQTSPNPLLQLGAMANISLPSAQAVPNPLLQLGAMANIALPVAVAQTGPNPLQQMATPNIALPGINASATSNLLRQMGITPNIALPGINAQAASNPLRQMGVTSNITLPGINTRTAPNPLGQMGAAPNIALPIANTQAAANAPLHPVSSLLPEYRNVQKQDLLTGNTLGMPMEKTTYQHPYNEHLSGHANTSQITDIGLEGRRAEKFGKKRRSRFDDPPEPVGYMLSEMMHDKRSDMLSREWDEPSFSGNIPNKGINREYDDEERYSMVSLPLSNQRLEHGRFLDSSLIREIQARDIRPNFGERNLTSFEEPPWVDRDMYYGKRSRLDSDIMSSDSAEWGRHYPDQSDSTGIIPPQLSADLLKRIRGKDLFTVSAILSEVVDSHSSM